MIYRVFRYFSKCALRRERDSNPRYSCPYTAFRVRPDRPLRHLSRCFPQPKTSRFGTANIDIFSEKRYFWPKKCIHPDFFDSGGDFSYLCRGCRRPLQRTGRPSAGQTGFIRAFGDRTRSRAKKRRLQRAAVPHEAGNSRQRRAAMPHEAGNGRPRRHTRRETTGKGGPRCSICRPSPFI